MGGVAYIYALRDPRTDEVRYVGKTTNMRRRMGQHLHARSLARRTHLAHWLRNLNRDGLAPEMTVLEACPVECWHEAERRWITHYRGIGRLVNRANGGQGGGSTGRPPGFKHSPETRARMSESARMRAYRHTLTPEHLAALHSPESRAKRSTAMTGRKPTPERTAKVRASLAAYWTAERRAEMSAKMKLVRAGASA